MAIARGANGWGGWLIPAVGQYDGGKRSWGSYSYTVFTFKHVVGYERAHLALCGF